MGEGEFGRVLKCMNKANKEIRAVKILNKF